MEEVVSIKPGTPPTVDPDGTIRNPVTYRAINVALDDGTIVQVERPLSVAKIRAAYLSSAAGRNQTVDGVSTGEMI